MCLKHSKLTLSLLTGGFQFLPPQYYINYIPSGVGSFICDILTARDIHTIQSLAKIYGNISLLELLVMYSKKGVGKNIYISLSSRSRI